MSSNSWTQLDLYALVISGVSAAQGDSHKQPRGTNCTTRIGFLAAFDELRAMLLLLQLRAGVDPLEGEFRRALDQVLEH